MIDYGKTVWAIESHSDTYVPYVYRYSFSKEMRRFFKEQAVFRDDGYLSHYGARCAIRDWDAHVIATGFYTKRPELIPVRKPLDLVSAFKILHEGGKVLTKTVEHGFVRMYLSVDRLFCWETLEGKPIGWVGYDMTAFMNDTFYEDK